jgi:hypothetical protein
VAREIENRMKLIEIKSGRNRVYSWVH